MQMPTRPSKSVRVAQASDTSADANVDKARAALTLARANLDARSPAAPAGYIAQSQYDIDYSNHVAAASALNSAVVTARQARMQLARSAQPGNGGHRSGKCLGFPGNCARKHGRCEPRGYRLQRKPKFKKRYVTWVIRS